MNKLFISLFLILFTAQVYSQTYLNIKLGDGSYKYAPISDITEITFNSAGTEMTIMLSSGSSVETVGGISEFTFDADILGGGSPLPVELVSFNAQVTEAGVLLNWSTATEVNNFGFDVERSTDGENFTKLGFVQGNGTTNSPKEYSFADSDLPDTEEVSYRLKQIDNDGTINYSKTVIVDLTTVTGIEDDVVYEFALKQNYPNPFNPSTTIYFQLPTKSFTTLKVYDILGNEVAELINEEKAAGKYSISFDGSQLASGVYFSRITAGSYTSLIKMLLIK